MTVLVCGSRSFSDFQLLSSKLDRILSESSNVSILSGGARGADSLAVQYARERGLDVEVIPANWDKFGRRAGFIRNVELVTKASHVVAFWDGKSKGTAHTIELSKRSSLPIRIIKF